MTERYGSCKNLSRYAKKKWLVFSKSHFCDSGLQTIRKLQQIPKSNKGEMTAVDEILQIYETLTVNQKQLVLCELLKKKEND